MAIKEAKQIHSAFYAKKKFLLFDPNSTTRNALRKILGQLQIKPDQIEFCESKSEILEYLSTKPVDVFIVDESGEGGSNLDLVDKFRAVVGNRLQSAIFILTPHFSPALACMVAEQEIDALIVKPFTADSVITILSGISAQKSSPTEAAKLVEAARQHLEKSEIDQAEAMIQDALTKSADDPAALCFFALIQRQKSELNTAKETLEKALLKHPKNYRCITAFIDLMIEMHQKDLAYDWTKKLIAEFPLNPKRIPDFVRLCIQNKQYQEVLEVYKIVLEFIPELDNATTMYLAAGLVVCGKFLLKQGQDSPGLDAIKKGIQISHEKIEIIKQALLALTEAKKIQEVEDLIKKLPTKVQETSELKMIQLECIAQGDDPGITLKAANELLQQGIKSPRIYELAIIGSTAIRRKEEAILELIDQAANAFPDHKEKFETLYKKTEPSA